MVMMPDEPLGQLVPAEAVGPGVTGQHPGLLEHGQAAIERRERHRVGEFGVEIRRSARPSCRGEMLHQALSTIGEARFPPGEMPFDRF